MQRTDRQFQMLPLVCVADQASVAQKVAAFQVGADDFWVKPFPPHTFLARVELLIRSVAMQRKLA